MGFIVTSSPVTNNSQPHHDRVGKNPQAAVFDCDGLLVDSQRCWERAYARVAAARARPLDDIRLERLLGASVAGAVSLLSEDLGEPIGAAELHAALAASFAEEPPEPLAGACALLAELASRMPLGVASNGPREIVLTVLDRLDVRELFAAVVSAEETARDKPEPHVYLEACRRLTVAPGDAIAFEDSPLGARAARRAGLFVVAVPSIPGTPLDADLTVPSLDDARLRAFLGLVLLPASEPDRVAPGAPAVGVDERDAAEAPAEV